MIEKILLLSMGLGCSASFLLLWLFFRFNLFISGDQLTGLYNFETIYKKYTSLVQKKSISSYVFVALDIDDFKGYNTVYGSSFGDEVLCYISRKLTLFIEPDEYIARIAGDNFVLLLKKSDNLIIRLNSLICDIKENFSLVDTVLSLSFGVVYLNASDVNYIDSNTKAHLAKKNIKSKSDEKIYFFDKKSIENIFEEQVLLSDFEKGLQNREFEMYYQIKYDIAENKPIGAEALVRWRHSVYGLLSPIKFIDLLERRNYITKLDTYVVEESCKSINELHKLYKDKLEGFRIAINLSGITFLNNEAMKYIESIISDNNIDPNCIEFELTESFFIDEGKHEIIVHTIDRLRKSGYHIAMDDFGVGSSSLNLLKNLSIDTLKIDKVFISEDTEKAVEIVETIINMAAKLGINTVAEGIETEEQLSLLLRKGCKIGQGYYYSRPIPFNQFKKEFFE